MKFNVGSFAKAILPILALSSVSCQVIFGKNKESRVVRDNENVSTTKPVASYSFDDPACQNSSGASDIGTQGVNLIRGTSPSAQTENFSGASANGSKGLRGTYVGASIVNVAHREEKSCVRSASGSLSCQSEGTTLISGGRPLYLCKKDYSYPRDSVEGVALATFYTIESAGKFYAENAKDGRKLEPVWQMVLPKIDVLYRGKSSDGSPVAISEPKSDNAFWSLAQGKTESGSTQNIKVISVLPASIEYQKTNAFGAHGLWELPFVVAHEYGHHIFYGNVVHMEALYSSNTTIVSEKHSSSAEKKLLKQLPWQTSLGHLNMANSANNSATFADAVTALNEGFADLFAEYAIGGSEHMRAVPGVCSNRQINLPKFRYRGSEQSKSLTASVIREFIVQGPELEGDLDVEGCAPVSLTDPHNIGAIFAHGFYNVLTALDNKADQLNTLVRWAQSLDATFASSEENLEELLNSAAFNMMEKASEAMPNKKLTAAQCLGFAVDFPESAKTYAKELQILGCP